MRKSQEKLSMIDMLVVHKKCMRIGHVVLGDQGTGQAAWNAMPASGQNGSRPSSPWNIARSSSHASQPGCT